MKCEVYHYMRNRKYDTIHLVIIDDEIKYASTSKKEAEDFANAIHTNNIKEILDEYEFDDVDYTEIMKAAFLADFENDGPTVESIAISKYKRHDYIEVGGSMFTFDEIIAHLRYCERMYV